MHWVGGRQYPLASDVLSAPVADAVRLITAIVRGERVCDGTIAAALEDGRLLAAVQRVSDHACAGREITRRGAQSAASDEVPPEHFIAVPPEPTPEDVRDIAGQLFDALQQDRAEHVHKMGAEGG